MLTFPNTPRETVQFLLQLAEKAKTGDFVLTHAAHQPPHGNYYVAPGTLTLVFAEMVPMEAAHRMDAQVAWSRWSKGRKFPRDPRAPR